jgi:hypothetical protein
MGEVWMDRHTSHPGQMETTNLWESGDADRWAAALGGYRDAIGRQGVERLPELDRWYREELPREIGRRTPPHVTHEELVRVTEWKMARGVWRARNLVLVKGNDPAAVVDASAEALSRVPDPRQPIAALARLAGVGPATASAVVAAAAPETYPFFDELVAAQVPGLGPTAYTLGYYVRYAAALRERAAALGARWTPARVEQALWADVGGKAGAAAQP